MLTVVTSLANNDDTIELLSFGLVHRHDLYPWWVIDATKDLVLGKG